MLGKFGRTSGNKAGEVLALAHLRWKEIETVERKHRCLEELWTAVVRDLVKEIMPSGCDCGMGLQSAGRLCDQGDAKEAWKFDCSSRRGLS